MNWGEKGLVKWLKNRSQEKGKTHGVGNLFYKGLNKHFLIWKYQRSIQHPTNKRQVESKEGWRYFDGEAMTLVIWQTLISACISHITVSTQFNLQLTHKPEKCLPFFPAARNHHFSFRKKQLPSLPKKSFWEYYLDPPNEMERNQTFTGKPTCLDLNQA